MPIYEYLCLECGRVSDHLVLNRASFEPYCKYCGAKRLKKLISRVRVRLSMETRLERLTDPALWGHVGEDDPQGMFRLLDRMGAEFGSELGDDFDELIESAREGIDQQGGGSKDESTLSEASPSQEEEASTEKEDLRVGRDQE